VRFLSQALLGVQRQLQQAFQQLVRRNADEVLEHEFRGGQAAFELARLDLEFSPHASMLFSASSVTALRGSRLR